RHGDASGNGLANAFYYLFDLGDPTEYAVPDLDPSGGILPGLPSVADGPDDTITYSYVFPRGALPFDAYPAISNDLETWLPADDPEALQPTSTSSAVIDEDYEIRRLHYDSPPTHLFFRIEIHESP
ncbi:MAG: hypothetical protein AAGC68_17355, partial [Verrucomicrobiota bacterium]